MHHKHLVYIKNTKSNDIAAKVNQMLNINNVNFLLNESEESIDLISALMYTSKASCRSIKLIAINRFTKPKMRWANSRFSPLKHQNLHGCKMEIGIRENWYGQIGKKIVESLSKPMNFDVNYIKIRNLEPESFNVTETDIFWPIELPFIHGYSYNFAPGVSFMFTQFTFAVPPGELYTPIEKMFIMFDLELWIAIIVTLLIAIVVIQIINKLPGKVRNYVFGRNVTTPTLNLQATFLTGAPSKSPGRNFARFLLMMFVLWSLVIRTCYQSKLYQYLQADLRKSRVRTIKEMLDQNFTIFDGSLIDLSTVNSEGRM